MAKFGGATLRFGALAVRVVQFICAAIVLGIYSYFLAVLSRHHTQIPQWEKGVEGLSGAAALYTLIAVLTTLFLGAKRGFAWAAIILDLCFFVCFIAIVVLTRYGADTCSGIVNTPLGTAPSNASAPGAGSYHYVCGLNSAAFAVAIINMLLFLISPAVQFLLMRHHQRDQTAASTTDMKHTTGRRMWGRK